MLYEKGRGNTGNNVFPPPLVKVCLLSGFEETVICVDSVSLVASLGKADHLFVLSEFKADFKGVRDGSSTDSETGVSGNSESIHELDSLIICVLLCMNISIAYSLENCQMRRIGTVSCFRSGYTGSTMKKKTKVFIDYNAYDDTYTLFVLIPNKEVKEITGVLLTDDEQSLIYPEMTVGEAMVRRVREARGNAWVPRKEFRSIRSKEEAEQVARHILKERGLVPVFMYGEGLEGMKFVVTEQRRIRGVRSATKN